MRSSAIGSDTGGAVVVPAHGPARWRKALGRKCGRKLRGHLLLGLAAGLLLPAAHAGTHAPYAVVARIPAPSGGWDYSTVDSSVDRLYLARGPGVLALDLKTHEVTATAFKGQGVHIAEPVGKTGLVLVTNGDTDTASIFESRTRGLVGTVKVGQGPDAAVYDPGTGLVAVINHRGGSVSLIDALQASLVRTIEVGGVLESAAPAGDGTLFVNVANRHEVAVLDLNAGTVLRRYPLKGCEDPSGLVYDAADNLLASVCGNGITKFLRAADGKPVATLHTGLGSDGLMFDARDKLLFVPAAKHGELTVVRLGAGPPRVVQRLKTGPGARSGAFDPRTGLIYLPSAKLGPPRPPVPWPTVVPGTFRILVVGAR